MDPVDDIPASFARHPLFAPIAPWLARFTATGVPAHAALNTLLGDAAADAHSGSGVPIRFVAPPIGGHASYEERIFASGEVPTRDGDWHDFFNALAWCAWPRTKSACNRLHLAEARAREIAGLSGRGPRRDALTQFDECGIVVVSADAEIPALLAAHDWEEAFWNRRTHLLASTRFLVFGHGSWDQLRAPFVGLCAKALYRVVDPAWLGLPATDALAETDAWLAHHLEAAIDLLTPRSLAPLPLLGIPGVTPDSACAHYYRDSRQFRPKRHPAST
ncbi:DUF3025 domain-containing protein [Thauera sp.]|jgi:hypothetical protein|uniref:DUF3025 domain-containing protein n=1 Tax=Thauera sp. TaxID=1905334 RepID=UPI002636934C|nr:DUF3025 domain-containing protein [Thauera sp.]MCK6408044.1 DUF3025 domain-containing protein [Thauera sp.]